MKPNRKDDVARIAIRLAEKFGAANVTRRMVANAAAVSPALVSYYFGDTQSARKKYAKYAKAAGLTLPNASESAQIGLRLRKHTK